MLMYIHASNIEGVRLRRYNGYIWYDDGEVDIVLRNSSSSTGRAPRPGGPGPAIRTPPSVERRRTGRGVKPPGLNSGSAKSTLNGRAGAPTKIGLRTRLLSSGLEIGEEPELEPGSRGVAEEGEGESGELVDAS